MVVMNAVDMSQSETSLVTVLQSITKAAYAVTWTGTSPVGTLSIQASNDYSIEPSGIVNNAGTWTTLTLQYNGSAVTTIPVSGNTGTGLIDITTSAYAIRLIYTAASGTGKLTATIVGKVS